MTFTLILDMLPCQAPGDTGSVLVLTSPVSIYCDWVRHFCYFYLSVATLTAVCSRSVPETHQRAAAMLAYHYITEKRFFLRSR